MGQEKKWSELSLRDKASLIKKGVLSGITDLGVIEGMYNSNVHDKVQPSLVGQPSQSISVVPDWMKGYIKPNMFGEGGDMSSAEEEVEMLPEFEVIGRQEENHLPIQRLQEDRQPIAFGERPSQDNEEAEMLPEFELEVESKNPITVPRLEEERSEEPQRMNKDAESLLGIVEDRIPATVFTEHEMPKSHKSEEIARQRNAVLAENTPRRDIEPELKPDSQRKEPPVISVEEELAPDSTIEEKVSQQPDEELKIDAEGMADRVNAQIRHNISEMFGDKLREMKPLTEKEMDEAYETAKRAIYREDRIKIAENIKRAVSTLSTQENPKLIRGMEDGYNCIYNVLSAFDNTFHQTGRGKRPELSNARFRTTYKDYGFSKIGTQSQQQGFYFDKAKHSGMLRIGDVLSFQHPLEGWSHCVMVTGFDKDGEPLISYSHGRAKNEDDYKIYDDYDKSEAGYFYNKTKGRTVHEPTMVHNRRLSDAYKWEEDTKDVYKGDLKPMEKICVYRYTGTHNGVQKALADINGAYKR